MTDKELHIRDNIGISLTMAEENQKTGKRTQITISVTDMSGKLVRENFDYTLKRIKDIAYSNKSKEKSEEK